MFTTAHNLTNLASADIIYGDGTWVVAGHLSISGSGSM
jgi:hypothetical protein